MPLHEKLSVRALAAMVEDAFDVELSRGGRRIWLLLGSCDRQLNDFDVLAGHSVREDLTGGVEKNVGSSLIEALDGVGTGVFCISSLAVDLLDHDLGTWFERCVDIVLLVELNLLSEAGGL